MPSNYHPPQETKSDKPRSKTLMTLQRRGQIIDLLKQKREVRVNELADLFQVSEVTIRSDLDQLEREGRLLRDRGGAIAAAGGSELKGLLGIEKRSVLQVEEKSRIARVAAQLVQPGDMIIMDAGTTVVEMAKHLKNITPLTVVTNALNVALEVSARTEAHVILLGGNLSRESSSTLGSLAEHTLADLNVSKAFLGTQAFDLAHGLSDTTMEIAQIKRAMIRSARQVILLTDSAKWALSGFIKVAPLSSLHKIVTDTNFPPEARAAVEEMGIELLLA